MFLFLKRVFLFCFGFFVFFAAPVQARDIFLVISGGGWPASNHYSQYLQTRTMAHYLQGRFGSDQVSVYFGVGNNPKTSKIFPDVHALVNNKGGETDKMVFGSIAGNNPATKDNIIAFFKGSKAQSLTKNDTLYIFVSDHGMPSGWDVFDNNCMDLWSYDPKTQEREDFGASSLSKNELKELLASKIKAKKTVYVMSQCFSGGFHQMSVGKEGDYPTANINLCGFASVTEDLTAAGCTAAVNESDYKGYERHVTQQLTGTNVITGQPMPYRLKATLQEAHDAAALGDMTVDIPLTTSDYFLLEWYKTIEKTGFKPRTHAISAKQVKEILENMISGAWDAGDVLERAGDLKPLMQKRLHALKKQAMAIVKHDSSLFSLVQGNSQKAQTDFLKDTAKKSAVADNQFSMLVKQYWKLRRVGLFPAWLKAIKNKEVFALNKEQQEDFEQGFFVSQEALFMKEEDTDALLDDSFVLALADMTKKDPEKAKRFALYNSQRDGIIYGWGEKQGAKKVRAVVKRLKDLDDQIVAIQAPMDHLDIQAALIKRLLFARQQIAAALALVAMQDEKALSALKGLTACEETKF